MLGQTLLALVWKSERKDKGSVETSQVKGELGLGAAFGCTPSTAWPMNQEDGGSAKKVQRPKALKEKPSAGVKPCFCHRAGLKQCMRRTSRSSEQSVDEENSPGIRILHCVSLGIVCRSGRAARAEGEAEPAPRRGSLPLPVPLPGER